MYAHIPRVYVYQYLNETHTGYVSLDINIRMYICVRVFVYVYLCTCICVRVFVYVYLCTCIYVMCS